MRLTAVPIGGRDDGDYLRPRALSWAGSFQDRLRKMVRVVPLKKAPAYIAAVDAAFVHKTVIAVACLYSYPTMEHKEDAICVEDTEFPYIPGYLAFREGHAIIEAVKGLKLLPDLLLVDGQGIAHPKGVGSATHIGVILGIPSVGCAKSRLVGEFDELAASKGSWSYLSYGGVHVGAVVRTRSEVRPVFVSPGHMTDISSSVEVVLRCAVDCRIPEPLRRADIISRQLARESCINP